MITALGIVYTDLKKIHTEGRSDRIMFSDNLQSIIKEHNNTSSLVNDSLKELNRNLSDLRSELRRGSKP